MEYFKDHTAAMGGERKNVMYKILSDMDRWVQGIMTNRSFIQQKRVAYFDCTAALDDSCAALFHAELPSFSLPASLVRLHLRHARVDVAGLRRSFVD